MKLVMTKMIKKDKAVWTLSLFWAGVSEGYFSWMLVLVFLGLYTELGKLDSKCKQHTEKGSSSAGNSSESQHKV